MATAILERQKTTNIYFLLTFWLLMSLVRFDACYAASSVPLSDEPEGPWFTGPLLTPSARVLPKGHINIQPYLFWNVATGFYDDHWNGRSIPTFNAIRYQVQMKYGLGHKLGLNFAPSSFLNFTRGKTGSSFADLPIGLEYQLFEGKPDDWLTFAKLAITEIFPTGKYQHLDPAKHLTDAGGEGSYITIAALTFSKLIELPCHKYLGTRWNFSVLYFSNTPVRGFSIYGGDRDTRGTIHHGASYLFFAGAEYTVTKEFSLACDFFARYVQRKTFKGFSNFPIFRPEQIQFSLAPAIEYNWSASMGLIIGAWFSVAGRNTERFINGVAAFNYVY